MQDIGLYVHIPFCRSKCLYCDFNSYKYDESDSRSYIEALLRELDEYNKIYSFRYKTVFIGGGTPTVINYFLIGSIMEKIAPFINSGAEVTMESNPGTVTLESLRYYRSLGINRLSIGLQAWQGELLKRLGRIHGPEDFLHAFESARESGFDNINADLIFALPNQTLGMWKETLKKTADLGVDHISCYSLILEEGTGLYDQYKKGRVQLPDEETDREMYSTAIEILGSYGYGQYEISNFARKGKECRHNLIYWRNEEYLGVGAGSHSRLGSKRFWNYKDIASYIRFINEGKLPVEGSEELSPGEEMWETIFLSLRLNEGLNIIGFKTKYDIDFLEKYGDVLKRLINQGLVIIEDNSLKLTARGRDLSNSVFIEFM